jgi:hypothetical protein
MATGALWWSANTRIQDPLPPDQLSELKPNGEWNDMEVHTRGQSLRIVINGREVQNVMLNKTRPQKFPVIGLNRFSGRIGFLKRAGEVRFRKVEIKELGPAGVKADAGSPAAEPAGKVYELRVNTTVPGKLDALTARFRDHTIKRLEKHGMASVGYWTPVDNPDGKLYYMLAHASRAAADESWKAFADDPEWKALVERTEANGRIVAKREGQFLTATDYSPAVKPPAGGEHVYELRTAVAAPGRLDALSARFRDRTMALFQRHGMTSVAYWTPTAGEPGAANTLVYLLAHNGRGAAKDSWAAFQGDPDWTAARTASEEKAGASLMVPGGVTSVFLKPTDFSAMK